MRRIKAILLISALVFCSAVLSGCDSKEKKKEAEDANKVKDELIKVNTELSKANSDLANITTELNKVKSLKAELESQAALLREESEMAQPETNKPVQVKKETGNIENVTLVGSIFTTGIADQVNMPVNSLSEISISEKVIYLYMKWTGMVAGDVYTNKVKIFDGEGNLINEDDVVFTPTKVTSISLCGYYINRFLDKPGKWRFEIYLNGQKIDEKYLTVLSDSGTEAAATPKQPPEVK